MLRREVNFWINWSMLFVFAACMFSGFVLWFLPSGSHQGHVQFYGLSKYYWKEIHVKTGLILSILILSHILLHARWFLQVIRKRKR